MFALRRTLRWLLNFVSGVLQRLLLWILASGPLPNHIAFVMDGNRRYAGKKGKPINEGHYAGYSALYRVSRITIVLCRLTILILCQMLEICFRLRIRAVSVYAFAINNFNRSPAEVDAIMNLCTEKLTELCAQG